MFISFEGVDSCGKTTQIKNLHSYFLKHGIDSVLTKEPGGCDSAAKIRSLLLDNDCFLPQTQLLLINASRIENVNKVIKPALQQGKIVLCDRFIDSTVIYQAKKAGLGEELIAKIHNILFGDFMPNVTFYLQITKQTAIKRINAKKGSLFSYEEHNWMDDDAASNIEKMIAWFDDIAKKNPNRIIVIDANEQPDVVFNNILNQIERLKILQNLSNK